MVNTLLFWSGSEYAVVLRNILASELIECTSFDVLYRRIFLSAFGGSELFPFGVSVMSAKEWDVI